MPIKTILTYCCLVLFGSAFYSQTRFAMPTFGILGQHVIEYDSNYIAVNKGIDNGFLKFTFQKFSKTGDSISSWSFIADTNQRNSAQTQHSYTRIGQSNYIAGRSSDTMSNNIKGLLAKFNTDYSQVLGFSNYYYYDYTSLEVIAQDGDDLICGFTKIIIPGKVFFSLVKMDTTGTILWEKLFINHTHLYNIDIFGITKSTDGGYLLKTSQYNNKVVYGHDPDSVFTVYIKVDSLGNEEWQHRIGSNTTLNKGSNAVVLSDSNFLVVWGDSEINGARGGSHRINDSSTMHVAKLDQNGTILWEKNLYDFLKFIDTPMCYFCSEFYYYHVWKLHQLKDKSIAIIGNTWTEGFMLKINEEGEPHWYRKYTPIELPPTTYSEYSTNGIVGMCETSDSGFLLTGFNQYSGKTPAPWGFQTAYIYKVDKYGCLTKDCYKQDKWYLDSLQIIEDSLQQISKDSLQHIADSLQQIEDRLQHRQDSIAEALNKSNKGNTILAYPNPTHDNLTFKVPASYNFDIPISVFIYSSEGKLINSLVLKEYTTLYSVKSLSKGLYIFKFQNNVVSEEHKIIIY